MLLQTNSYIVPKEKRAEHTRLVRRFRHTLSRLGCEHFEVYEQVGANWTGGDSGGRFVQIMRFRDRQHQLAVNAAESTDPDAQRLIAEFCDLINLPYQQQQGLFAIGFYHSVLPTTPPRLRPPADVEEAAESDGSAALYGAAAGAVGGYAAHELTDEAIAEDEALDVGTAEDPFAKPESLEETEESGGTEAPADEEAALEVAPVDPALDEVLSEVETGKLHVWAAPAEGAEALESSEEVEAAGEQPAASEEEAAEIEALADGELETAEPEVEAEGEEEAESTELLDEELAESEATEEEWEPLDEAAAEAEGLELDEAQAEETAEEGEPAESEALAESEELAEDEAVVEGEESEDAEWATEEELGESEVEETLDEAVAESEEDESLEFEPIAEAESESLEESEALSEETIGDDDLLAADDLEESEAADATGEFTGLDFEEEAAGSETEGAADGLDSDHLFAGEHETAAEEAHAAPGTNGVNGAHESVAEPHAARWTSDSLLSESTDDAALALGPGAHEVAERTNGHPVSGAHHHTNGDAEFFTDAQIDEALNEAMKEIDEFNEAGTANPPARR